MSQESQTGVELIDFDVTGAHQSTGFRVKGLTAMHDAMIVEEQDLAAGQG